MMETCNRDSGIMATVKRAPKQRNEAAKSRVRLQMDLQMIPDPFQHSCYRKRLNVETKTNFDDIQAKALS